MKQLSHLPKISQLISVSPGILHKNPESEFILWTREFIYSSVAVITLLFTFIFSLLDFSCFTSFPMCHFFTKTGPKIRNFQPGIFGQIRDISVVTEEEALACGGQNDQGCCYTQWSEQSTIAKIYLAEYVRGCETVLCQPVS